jgi:hypothetical protein
MYGFKTFEPQRHRDTEFLLFFSVPPCLCGYDFYGFKTFEPQNHGDTEFLLFFLRASVSLWLITFNL